MSRIAYLLGVILVVGCSKLESTSQKSVSEGPKKSEPAPAPAPAPTPAPPAPAPKPPAPTVVNLGLVDGHRLELEYATDGPTTHKTYQGKIMTLPVVVTSMTKSSNGEFIVCMSTKYKKGTMTPDEPNYFFYFPKGNQTGVEGLSAGASVFIEGVCTHYETDNTARGGDPKYKWKLNFFKCRLVVPS